MYSAEEELDEMVARIARRGWGRSAPRPPARRFASGFALLGHDACGCGTGCGDACGCGCISCGGRDESTALGAPVAAGGATPASAVSAQLPAWRGWSAPQRLSTLVAGSTTPPSAIAAFRDRGSRVYRITREGLDTARPLSIGMTISNSILERVLQHHTGHRDGDRNVAARISGLPQSRVIVQAAMLDRRGMHPRRAKSYENWLQDRERPRLYSRNTTTFESSDVRRGY